jgi:3-polyprenyl-4-hydroxybenzoate decarboxylase
MRLEFGVELPPFEGASVEGYLAAIAEIAPKKVVWRVRRQVAIGVFPSARMAMYHDIDPSNLNDVMWAISTRCEPSEQVDILRNAWSSALDPRLRSEDRDAGQTSHSKIILDACKPFAWRERYPKVSALSQDETRAIVEKWFR